MKPLTCLKNTRSSGTEFVWMYLETAVYKSVILYPGKVLKYFLELLQMKYKLLPVLPSFTAFVNLVSSSPSALLGQLFCWQYLNCCSLGCTVGFVSEGTELVAKDNICTEKLGSPKVYFTPIGWKCEAWDNSVKEFSSSKYSLCVFPLVLEKQVLIR